MLEGKSKATSYSWQVLFCLMSMAIFAFCLGMNEFITIGLLPDIAHTFSISIPTAGGLTSIFTFGAGVSAPIIAYFTLRVKRKRLLCTLMAIFIVAVIISAMAKVYSVLLLGRILTSLCHGSFFGIGVVVVSNMVPQHKATSAISFVFTGLTISNLLGVPIGTILGEKFGWQSIFWILVVISFIAFLGVLTFIPRNMVISADNIREELRIFKKAKFWLAFLTTAFGYCGMLSSYTYMSGLMTQVSKFSESDLGWLTAVYGLGAVIGNILGGKAADRYGASTAVYTLLTLLAIVLFAFTFTAYYSVPSVITLFFLALVGFSLIAPLMQYVISRSEGAATMASTANITGFGLGITLGVYLSGLAIEAGLGCVAPNWVGGILTSIGLGFALLGAVIFKDSRVAPSELEVAIL